MTVICRLDDVPDRSGRGYTVMRGEQETAIMVVRLGRMVRAYVNVCPHLALNLDWEPDAFFDFERRHILCGKHGALFRVADGLCVYGPCLGRSLQPVPIEIQDGEVRLAP